MSIDGRSFRRIISLERSGFRGLVGLWKVTEGLLNSDRVTQLRPDVVGGAAWSRGGDDSDGRFFLRAYGRWRSPVDHATTGSCVPGCL